MTSSLPFISTPYRFVTANVVLRPEEIGGCSSALEEQLEESDLHYTSWSWQDIAEEIGSSLTTPMFEALSPTDKMRLLMVIISYLEGDVTLSSQIDSVDLDLLNRYVTDNPDHDLIFRASEDGPILAIHGHVYSRAMSSVYTEITTLDFQYLKPDATTPEHHKVITDGNLFTLRDTSLTQIMTLLLDFIPNPENDSTPDTDPTPETASSPE